MNETVFYFVTLRSISLSNIILCVFRNENIRLASNEHMQEQTANIWLCLLFAYEYNNNGKSIYILSGKMMIEIYNMPCLFCYIVSYLSIYIGDRLAIDSIEWYI